MEENQLEHKLTRASDYDLESLVLLYQLNLSIEGSTKIWVYSSKFSKWLEA